MPASVKAMMPHLLTDEVAQHGRPQGQRHVSGPQYLPSDCRYAQFCEAICFYSKYASVVLPDSVRRSKFLGDSARSEVEMHIREWLRRAKEKAAFGLKKT